MTLHSHLDEQQKLMGQGALAKKASNPRSEEQYQPDDEMHSRF